MLWAVRPLLRRIVTAGSRPGTVLPVLLSGLLLSAGATELIGLHFIFGAFLFGVVVPHEGTVELRETVLERIGEFNAALLLPVFFIVAGLQVNLASLGSSRADSLN